MIIKDKKTYDDTSDVLLGLTAFFLKYGHIIESDKKENITNLVEYLVKYSIKYEKEELNR